MNWLRLLRENYAVPLSQGLQSRCPAYVPHSLLRLIHCCILGSDKSIISYCAKFIAWACALKACVGAKYVIKRRSDVHRTKFGLMSENHTDGFKICDNHTHTHTPKYLLLVYGFDLPYFKIVIKIALISTLVSNSIKGF